MESNTENSKNSNVSRNGLNGVARVDLNPYLKQQLTENIPITLEEMVTRLRLHIPENQKLSEASERQLLFDAQKILDGEK